MIGYKEFEVIRTMLKVEEVPCDIPSFIIENDRCYIFKSKEEVTGIVANLEKKKYLRDGIVTNAALMEIEPLKVNNAVILAAGGSDISAKSVYSMPKGLYIKNGETLIERQIRQLREAGIQDIVIIIGYKQEMYFFLAEKYNVTLEINPDLSKNNIYSLYVAINHLSSTYICNCDNYFEKNPFSQYEYCSYHAAVYKENAHNELLVRKNSSGRILEIYSGDKSGECIYGHAYIDNNLSYKLVNYMKNEINDFRVSSLFWEEFIGRHAEDLDMYIRKYDVEFLYEFDSIQEIQNIDSLFFENVSEKINEKIYEVFNCTENEINNIEILQKGLTNILFTFYIRGEKYIFRYPGESSSFFIYRKNEVRAQMLAAKAEVDNTYIYIDETGIKISKFMSDCKNLCDIYYKDIVFMKHLARQIRKFHEEGFDMPDWKEFEYNPIWQCEHLMKEASKIKENLFDIFASEWKAMRKLYVYTEKDGIRKTMCHNDINQDNCLFNDKGLNIIDWEFAGFNDPAYDFGRVIAGYELDDTAIDEIIEAYFGRPATEIERLHWIAYIGIHNWYYVGWALYKESINESSRDWMLFFYKQVKRVIKYALPKYETIYGKLYF